ncbi:hypothetical protein J2X31_001398 [Flavobacterium arsenatis]|uniref:YhhN-like protein n=1 Tax=Flavobacterium arsenatis TaxID=1484332 RepID=A0ABU1TPQ4_9FLAO|nr:hypothetical protein [Flavobacterium arsenatis]MDR6967387.1 hypothetical protein [Flavobacterium arsenatis]
MQRYIADFNYLLLLINLVLLLSQFKKYNRTMRIFTFYMLVIAVIQLTTRYYSRNGLNNLFLSHFYFILQFVLLSLFYKTILPVISQKRSVVAGLFLCFIILGIQYYLNPSLFYTFNLLEIFITSFLILIYALFHFYNILAESKQYYYLNTGIFIYIFGSTVLFMSGDILSTIEPSYGKIIYTLNGFLYVVYQVYIFIEWRRIKKADSVIV